jgi:hypothetical protein
MTVLAAVTAVCRELNEPAPASLYGSTDPNALQWLALFYKVGEKIYREFDYPTLKVKYEFTTTSGTKIYPLPGNYWRPLLNTQWDETNQWMLFGPLDDGSLVENDLGVAGQGLELRYRIVGPIAQTVAETSFTSTGGYIELSQTPTDTRTLYIEYISSNWFFPIQWAASTSYTSGNFISANGAIYKATSTASSNSTRPSGESTTTLQTGASFQLWRDARHVIGADTDYPIIDPQIIRRGLLWAWRDSKKLDASVELDEFQRSIILGCGRFQGPMMIDGTGEYTDFVPNVPPDFVTTGWS